MSWNGFSCSMGPMALMEVVDSCVCKRERGCMCQHLILVQLPVLVLFFKSTNEQNNP